MSKIEKDRDRGELPLMVDGQIGVAGGEPGDAAQRDLLAGIGFDIDFPERIGAHLVGRIHFENQRSQVLIVFLVNGRNLALPKGIVEGIVDHLGIDAEARGGIAIDDDIGLESPGLLITGNILQLRILFERVDEPRRVFVQLVQIT